MGYYRIDAQPLARALMEYSEQAKVVLVVPAGMLEGKTSNAVEGWLVGDAALEMLLKGTGLSAERLENGALTLQSELIEEPTLPQSRPRHQNSRTRQCPGLQKIQRYKSAKVFRARSL